MTFTSELQTAATALEQHRPDGACDGDCGCVSDGAGSRTIPATIQGVSLSAKHTADGERPISCTLAAESMKGRIADWQALITHVERREPVDGGVRCVFASTVPTSQLIALVAAEQDCCQFFEFAITVDSRGIALEVRAPADALPIVTSMFGTSR